MICPRCRTESLVERARRALSIDVCRGCGGVWLDRGELEQAIGGALDEHVARHDRTGGVRFYGEPQDHDDDDERRPRGGRRRWLDSLGDLLD